MAEWNGDLANLQLDVALALYERGLTQEIIGLTDHAPLGTSLAIVRALCLTELGRLEEAEALRRALTGRVQDLRSMLGADRARIRPLDALWERLERLTDRANPDSRQDLGRAANRFVARLPKE